MNWSNLAAFYRWLKSAYLCFFPNWSGGTTSIAPFCLSLSTSACMFLEFYRVAVFDHPQNKFVLRDFFPIFSRRRGGGELFWLLFTLELASACTLHLWSFLPRKDWVFGKPWNWFVGADGWEVLADWLCHLLSPPGWEPFSSYLLTYRLDGAYWHIGHQQSSFILFGSWPAFQVPSS